MKKILGLLMLLVSLHGYAKDASMELKAKDKVDVELKEEYSSRENGYLRTLLPITCVYTDGMVQLTLLGEVGDYILTVTNQQTGERWSAENALTLQTSMAIGSYVVEIELEDGTVYYGTYTL